MAKKARTAIDPDLADEIRVIANGVGMDFSAAVDKLLRMGVSRWTAIRKYGAKTRASKERA